MTTEPSKSTKPTEMTDNEFIAELSEIVTDERAKGRSEEEIREALGKAVTLFVLTYGTESLVKLTADALFLLVPAPVTASETSVTE